MSRCDTPELTDIDLPVHGEVLIMEHSVAELVRCGKKPPHLFSDNPKNDE